MPSPSGLPIESATGWLPTVSAANPASTASFADQASHTVGKITGFPGTCNASSVVARSCKNLFGHLPTSVSRRDLCHSELADVASINCRTVIHDTLQPKEVTVVHQQPNLPNFTN